MEQHFTVKQVAELWNCDDETVLAPIHSGELQAVNICKSLKGKRPTWRIPETAAIKFLIGRRNQAAQSTVPAKKRPQPKQFV